MESAESQFSKISAQYDAQRKFMIPRFDDFYAAASDFTLPPSAQVIDLGAGTGILSARVLEKNPTAQIELLDVSEKMLEQARLRLAGANVKYTLSDFASWNPQPRSFDAVISALAIHHIPDAEKIALYKKIFGAMKDGGIFVNANRFWAKPTPKLPRTPPPARKSFCATCRPSRRLLRASVSSSTGVRLSKVSSNGFLLSGFPTASVCILTWISPF